MPEGRAPKSYFEPWAAARSRTWESGFGLELPPAPDTWDESDKRQWDAGWKAKRVKAEAEADWILWGSQMQHPTIAVALLGKPVVIDDQGIVVVVRKSKAWPGGGPSPEEVAKRIAACVTACAAIADPIKFITDVCGL